MGSGGKVMFFLMLITSCFYAHSRSLVISEDFVAQLNNLNSENVASLSREDERVCTFCEQFASQAIYYLGKNKTQMEIIGSLHLACSQMPSFSQECISLVDFYAPLLLMEFTNATAEEFCIKVNLCGSSFISKSSQDGCNTCHQAVAEILVTLKDPDTQFEVIKILLKACEKVENHVKECKKLVLEYGPLLMTNAEKFLETRDICKIIHACKTSAFLPLKHFPKFGILLPSEAIDAVN